MAAEVDDQAEDGYHEQNGHEEAVAEEKSQQSVAARGKVSGNSGDAKGGGHPQVHLLHENGHAGAGHAHGAGIVVQVLHRVLPRGNAALCFYEN